MDHEFRIYGDDMAQTWVVVDEIDYHWAIKWKWHFNKPHKNRAGKKEYLRRSASNGKRYLPPIYLHVEVMKRTGKAPPSELHLFVDHRDGNEFNCRRSNLRWATASLNAKNRNGKHSHDETSAILG